MRYRILPERGKSRKIESILVIADDVSDAKRLESALRERERRSCDDLRSLRQNEDKYRTIFTNMADEAMLWQLKRNRSGGINTWRLLDINPAGLKRWRKTRQQTVGKLADEIFPGATRRFMPVVQKTFAKGHAYSWETYVPWLKQHLKMTNVPFDDCFVTTGVDVTSSKVAALALQVSEERLRLALQAADMGAFDWDLVSGKVTWTPNNERLWGLKPGQFKGTFAHVRALLHPADRARCAALVRRALADSSKTYDMEHRVVLPDKSVRWIAAKASIIRDASGKPIRMVGVHTDVTDQRAARAQLESERDRLDRLVRERTEEILRVQQQARISERLCGLGTLVAGLGHDMNNMLLPLRAQIEVLRADQFAMPARSQQSVDAIAKSVAYLQELTDSLHLLATEPELDQNGSTDLSDWWRRAQPVLINAVPKRVSVSARIPRNLPKVGIASQSLTQAALNLMVNAGESIPTDRRYPRGQITISAAIKDPRTVQLVVKDNGRGMTDEVRRNAFDIFFTTRPRGMGTGLGLTLVRRLMDRAGGQVKIASVVGRGTSVSLLLPAQQRTPKTKGLTATITIDDHRALAITRQLLEAWNVEVSIGRSPGRADVWIVEPDPALLSQARRWRARRGNAGRLVVIGAAPSGRSAGDWGSVKPLIVPDAMDLVNLRAVLARAVNPD